MSTVSTASPAPRRWHKFLAMLPQIVTHAKIAFRHVRGQDRLDLIQETIANAFVAFVALVRRKKADLAYPSVLARYAVAQVKDGRRVGNRLRIGDVLSPYAQRHKGFKVERLECTARATRSASARHGMQYEVPADPQHRAPSGIERAWAGIQAGVRERGGLVPRTIDARYLPPSGRHAAGLSFSPLALADAGSTVCYAARFRLRQA